MDDLFIENNCITVHFKNDCLLDVVAVVIRSVMFPELLCFTIMKSLSEGQWETNAIGLFFFLI